MIRVSFFLRAANKNGFAVIYYYVHVGSQRNKVHQSTFLKIHVNDWNNEAQRSKTNQQINESLDMISAHVRAIGQTLLVEGFTLTPDLVLAQYLKFSGKRQTITIGELIEKYVDEKELENSAKRLTKRTLQMYHTRLKVCRDWLNKRNLYDQPAEKFTYKVLNEFYRYLVERDLSNDYIMKTIQFLRQVYNYGQRHELVERNPTKAFRLSFDYDNKRDFEYLDEFDFIKLKKASFASDNLNTAKDVFVFQCLTGFAYSDLQTFDPKKHLVRQTGKTFIHKPRQKSQVTALLPFYDEAQAILAQYNGKLPIPCQQYYNRSLKEIAHILGIRQKLTSHIARRTAAMLWLNSGIRLEVVSRMLGHSSTKVTQRRYATLSTDSIWKEAGSWKVGA